MKLPGKIAINTIQQNLPNLTTAQLDLFTQSISLSPSDVVSVDVKQIISTVTDKTFSMRLRKWVEPYTIGGVDYSLFYTEVDHNFKVGDRAFIEGGVYDSDNFSLVKKYRKGSDGYKVLYVDRCKIVLDIKYTGQLPTNEEEIDNFVKIYVASTQEEFDYYCQVLSLRQDSGIIHNKFDLGFNNFLYLNGTFSITPGSYNLTSFASDFALTSTSSTLGDSFVIRGATGSPLNTYFINITTDVFNNSFIPYLNSGWTQSLSGFFNNGKLRMMNGNFIKNGVSFKNEYIYYFDTLTNTWKIDKSYLPTILTEQHFRKGIFNTGKYNQGLYGQHEERIKYYGDSIKWNLGTTLNVDWYSGVLDSTVFNENSHFTIFDRFNLPQIRANAANNGGAGYNYVFNTNFYGGDVINGNIFNMAVVYGTNSATASALENYLTGQDTNFSINIKGGVYYNSDIIFASMSNSTLISSYVFNSVLNKCKSVNSEIEASVFLNSTWLSDKIVKIQNYEESNIVWCDENSLPINYKMYKFYLTDTNWLRLREFQNFYFQDLGINIPSTELLNFFDDKFSVGQYYQSYDNLTGTPAKPERRVLIQLSTARENRNSPGTIVSTTPQSNGNNVQPNDVALPSLDIFIEGGDNFDYATGSVYPRPFINETIDISKAYILDSDFVSGLFKNSRWISGNYFSYNKDHAFSSSGGYTASVNSTNKTLELTIGPKRRYDILGTMSTVSDIAFLNGLYYDSTLNGGNNLIPLNDTYKITNLVTSSGGRTIQLQDIMTQSVISSFGNFTGAKYLITKNAKNRWNYVHSTKFENSIISSGIFRRGYFKNCQFENFEFDSTDRDLTNISNKRKLLLSDIIFDGDGNTIKSGLVQYSHLVSGNDIFNNGIFHRGVWNTSTFTYSLSPTSSVVYTSGSNTFKNGIMRNSTWIDGTFENGLFYKNNTNIPATQSIVSNTDPYYYFDNITNNNLRWSWQRGLFKNGDFEKSNFETGLFSNGNFYDSNFLTGEATGGNFGKSNIPYQNSRVWTGTFSNVNVINAEFRTQDSTDNLNRSSIIWNSGVFNSGVFGVNMYTSYVPTTHTFSATWLNGTFNNGEFTDVAEWRNGEFNNGKFTSYYWYESSNPRTPFEISSFTSASFSWQNGKFNGGQFGTGLTGPNSTWFNGEFNGGIFQGRYWRNGILTGGKFLGHATQSTNIVSYNDFIRNFNSYYYGFWQDGFVSKNKDKFIKDEKFYSDIKRISSRKKKSPEVKFQNMLWNSGTFSNFDGEMDNSVWLDGTFQDGYFSNSSFNPYINLVSDRLSLPIVNVSNNFVSGVLEPGRTYTIFLEIGNTTTTINSPIVIPAGTAGFTQSNFVATTKNFTLNVTGNPNILNVEVYPANTSTNQSGFRISDSCIWENGEAYSSDFYFSKWKQGIFDSHATSSQGNSFGLIWQDGISKYMNAYNVFWESGTWKNGNWYGSPFTQIGTYSGVVVYPGFASDIINNVYLYASQSLAQTGYSIYNNWDQLHMNDTFTSSSPVLVLNDPGLLNNFSLSNRSIDQDSSIWTWTNFPSGLGPFVGYIPFFFFVADIYTIDAYNKTPIIYTNSSGNKVWAWNGSRNIFNDITKTYTIKVKYFAVYNSATVAPTFINLNHPLVPLPAGFPEDGYVSPPTGAGSLQVTVRFDVGYSPTLQNGGFFDNVVHVMPLSIYGDGKFGSTGMQEANFTFRPLVVDPTFLESQTLSIRKLSGSTGIRLYIAEISIQEQEGVYETSTNNENWDIQLSSNIQAIDNTINLPSNILYEFAGVNTRFGNGQFLSGIWENGVWNEGWREDLTVIWCDNLTNFSGVSKSLAYKNNIWTWTFQLNVLNVGANSNGFFYDYEIGDKVSVGNLVTIDINGNRRLIRNYLTIIDLDLVNTSMTLELNISFPIRSIERDSEEHLMYVTKNVWLNGIFLNGKFKDGVWSNGLFQGYPYITEMENSQWVDGIFKGGRFFGLTNSYIDENEIETAYHTALIQKFDFYDRNVSGLPYKFKYNSWIDVNYYKNEGVNINRINDVYKLTALGVTTSFIENNYYGYPTKDVLESNSFLRNAFDLDVRSYRLGWKWKEYTNYLDGFGQFLDINEYSFNNSTPATSVSGFGIDNFINNGWTFSWLGSNQGFATAANSIKSNIGLLESEWLYLSGGRTAPQSVPFDDNINFTVDSFNNENVTIDKLRYSFIEIEAENIGWTQSSSGATNPWLFYNTFPGSYSIAAITTLFNGNDISLPVNQVATQSILTNQREYFFNKKKLDMTILSGPAYSLRFKKIRFVETDMIPFIQIADDCILFQSVTTWDTTPGVLNPGNISGPAQLPEWGYVGPPLDPGENGTDAPNNAYAGTWEQALPFDQVSTSLYDGNLQLIDGRGFPTWDNFYLVAGGEGCTSYINDDIQVPNQSFAPDLSTDVEVSVITSTNIPLAGNPIYSSNTLGVSAAFDNEIMINSQDPESVFNNPGIPVQNTN